jgi:O-antigen ligase
LAAAGFVILLTTLSRGGVFNTLVTGVIVFVIAGFDRIKKGYLWFISPFRSGGQGSKWLRFAIVIGIVVIIASVFWYLNNSIYFSSLWGERLRGGLLKYLLANRVGSRLAYVYSGFGTFSLHPWTGVGLGGSGFYMMEYYPNWAFSVPEVELATQFGEIFRVVPNPKNLYIRLLAETGLVGFWLYLTMLFSMLGSFYRRLKRGDLTSRYIGTAGLFGWIAAVMTSFVQDSFAVPFSWVLLGMCLGFDRSLQKTEEGKQV